jgi:hypothetical protein
MLQPETGISLNLRDSRRKTFIKPDAVSLLPD